MKFWRVLLTVLFSLSPFAAHAESDQMSQKPPARSAYDFSFESIDGTPLPLSGFKGKVLLIVNTASECGFTPQYAGLQKLYDTYKARGFVVIGAPCNDFGDQEPGTAAEIKTYTAKTYGITFPLTKKVEVTGKDIHPFYKWAGEQGVGGIFGRKPMWNFHKYLVGRDGRLIDGYSPMTEPDNSTLKSDIENALVE